MNYPDPTSNEKQACKQWCLWLMVVIIQFIKFISRLCKGNYTTEIPPFCSTYFVSVEKPQCPQISTEEMEHFWIRTFLLMSPALTHKGQNEALINLPLCQATWRICEFSGICRNNKGTTKLFILSGKHGRGFWTYGLFSTYLKPGQHESTIYLFIYLFFTQRV